jgi:hypothetical protein
MLNAVALSNRLQISEHAKIKLSCWADKNLDQYPSVRARVKAGKERFQLVRVNWPGPPNWQLDMDFDDQGASFFNDERIKQTRTPWFEPAYNADDDDRQGKQGAAKKAKSVLRGLRSAAALDFHALSLRVELNIRTPLVIAVLTGVAQVLKSHAQGKLKVKGSGANRALTGYLNSAKTVGTVTICAVDLMAGVPRQRLRTAATTASVVAGVDIGVLGGTSTQMCAPWCSQGTQI